MSRSRFLPTREDAEKLRIAVGSEVWFNNRVYKVEVLGMRFCHLRNVADGTTVKFARLSDCHKVTGDESPEFSSTETFDYNSLSKRNR